MTPPRLLHVVVGYKLPVYFLNAVRSVRLCAPDDDLLAIDNASELPPLRQELAAIAAEDSRVRVIERTSNDLQLNAKVGSLYQAYHQAIDYALTGGYDFIHLIQGDMQMLWWEPSVLDEAIHIYDRFPDCVNVSTVALTRDRHLNGDTSWVGDSLMELTAYGLTDTGLYHLVRWRERGLSFGQSESSHSRTYREAGMRVICHPWAPVAPIPWPATVRNGRVRGREVEPRHRLLLRPLGPCEAAEVKAAGSPVCLEDVCVPWGWMCLTPMWPTAVESIDYLVFRWRDLIRGRWRSAWPRWDRRGIDPSATARQQRRPGIAELIGRSGPQR